MTRGVAFIAVAAAAVLAAAPAAAGARPVNGPPIRPVAEFNVPNAACGVAGFLSKAAAIACGALTNPGALLKGGKQVVTGHVGGAVSTLLGAGGGAAGATASTALGLAAIGIWVVGGAKAVLQETAAAISATTAPQLESTWFSSTYWRMAAIAAMLTLPFLFAATVQALLRSDISLLAKAAFGYLPLAVLSIAIAAPLTTLLLAASDELCGLISSAAADQASHLIDRIGLAVAGLTAFARSPFLAFLVGLFMIAVAFALWVELLLREAAVYVVVLMLPLAFAALTWPARRVWAIRAVEILVALIVSKFAIVAVLSLGGAAIDASTGHFGVTEMMAGTVLLLLAAFSPWALLRLVPLAEIATAAVGSLRREVHSADVPAGRATGLARSGDEWAKRTTAEMRRDADAGMADHGAPPPPPPRPAGVLSPASARAADSGPPDEADLGSQSPTESATASPPTTQSATASPPPTRSATVPPPPTESATASPPATQSAAVPPPPAESAAASPPMDESAPEPANSERPWSQSPVLELGPGFAGTPVWPHRDAE